ncbi:MAG: signal recognition particle-docking protein FtsY [Desulfobulbaceae bacterium]|nr:signal recognition particle-docking protein FtsY [Desulfobulbaceae bacterium]
MLAWFKKKFSKQQKTKQASETELREEEQILTEAPPPASEAVADGEAGAVPEIAGEVDTVQEPEEAAPPGVAPEERITTTLGSTLPAQEDLAPAAAEPDQEERATSSDAAGLSVGEEIETYLAEPEQAEMLAPASSPGLYTGEAVPQEGLETVGTALDSPPAEEELPPAEDPGVSELPDPSAATGMPIAVDLETAPEDQTPEAEEIFVGEESAQEAIATMEVEEEISAAEEVEKEETVADQDKLSPSSSFTQEKPAAKSMFRRLQDRLGKTRSSFVYQLDRLFMGEKAISQALFDQLEELLITADLGVSTTMELLDEARKRVKRDQLSDPLALKNILKEEMLAYITASDQPAELVMPEKGPFVIMVVGVNGVGKTTTIGKIAAKFVRSGQSTLLIAADTFRAAAIDQLKIWGERVGVEVVAQKPGTDPASVVFDGIDYGLAQDVDAILIDTAGRLHTSVNLMEELKKIQRVMGRRLPGAPHEVLLVLDATTGQNGIVQARLFHEAVGVSGLALTKLDGTAKGGIVANVCRELKIPVRFIGIGEQLDDLRDFNAAEFVDALFTESTR